MDDAILLTWMPFFGKYDAILPVFWVLHRKGPYITDIRMHNPDTWRI